MFQHPITTEMLAAQRREEFMAEAEQWRMLERSLDASLRPAALPERLLLGLARGLIGAGGRIQQAVLPRRTRREMRGDCETC